MIACYARVSTAEQAENGHSIDEQTERMQSYCDALGWSPVKIYTDAGFSGGNTERPALQNLIRDVKNGKVERVVVYKLDRLSRSQLDTLYLIEKVFLVNSCDFVSMSENFDTGSPFGRAMIGILAVFAQLEREQIKERMKMGKVARAKLGKFHGSAQIPIGYDYVDGELVTNEFEKAQVVDIFNWYLEGVSPPMIADRLNAAGRLQKNGRWLPYTVRKILERKTYLGFLFYDGKWYEGTHEAFITPELFEKVQCLKERKCEEHKKHNRRSGMANSFLGGFVYCANCGAKYIRCTSYGDLKSGERVKYLSYRCGQKSKKNKYYDNGIACKNRNWKMSELDALVFGEIKKLALDADALSKYEPKQSGDALRAVLSEIEKLTAQIDRLLDLYTVGDMPLDAVQKKINGLNSQREKLEQEAERLRASDSEKLSKADVLPLVQSFGDVLESGTLDEVRTVIGGLIDRIVIDGENVDIYWRF